MSLSKNAFLWWSRHLWLKLKFMEFQTQTSITYLLHGLLTNNLHAAMQQPNQSVLIFNTQTQPQQFHNQKWYLLANKTLFLLDTLKGELKVTTPQLHQKKSWSLSTKKAKHQSKLKFHSKKFITIMPTNKQQNFFLFFFSFSIPITGN